MTKRSAQWGRHQTRKQFVALHQHNKPFVPKVIIRDGVYIPWEIYHGSAIKKLDEAQYAKEKRATT